MNNSSINSSSVNAESVSRDSGRLVLVFGCDTETRFLYKTIVEMWSFRVAETDNLEDLLVFSARESPALILMDCALPFEKNLEAVRRIRENMFFNEIPIILTSGFANPQFRSFALFSGADELLVKPLNFDLLKTCLEKNIRKYAEKNTRREDFHE